MSYKLNLCCGDQYLEGWINADLRTCKTNDRIIDWKWGDDFGTTNQVDVIYIGYGLMYLEKENYEKELTKCFDVLNVDGVIIIKEDDNRKRIWGKTGTNKHGLGILKSTSNKIEMIEILTKIGFYVFNGYPIEFREILNTHKSAWKNSYILTGMKLK